MHMCASAQPFQPVSPLASRAEALWFAQISIMRQGLDLRLSGDGLSKLEIHLLEGPWKIEVTHQSRREVCIFLPKSRLVSS